MKDGVVPVRSVDFQVTEGLLSKGVEARLMIQVCSIEARPFPQDFERISVDFYPGL